MVKISAPNLLSFSFSSCGSIPEGFIVSSFPSLVEAAVHFVSYYEYEYPNMFVKLFEKLSSAKLLKLGADLFQ
ncbi:hypothetical protein MKW92_012691, partial [Papaver armeniacum]